MSNCPDCGIELEIGMYPFCKSPGGHGVFVARDAEGFVPPVVFVNPNGGDDRYMIPGRSDESCPAGYQRVELKSRPQIDRFMREYSAHQKSIKDRLGEMNEHRERFYLGASGANARRIAFLEKITPSLPPELRQRSERALEAAKSRSKSADAARYNPGVFFDAFENNSSNRRACDDRADMARRTRR